MRLVLSARALPAVAVAALLLAIACGGAPTTGKIAFESVLPDGNREIYVMNADGSGLINLTNNPTDDLGSTWQPQP